MSEVIALEVESARRLTERIRLIAQNVADNVEKLRELVQQAKESDAHVALGYSSWTAYLTDVFGDEPLRLARDVRQELVAELAAQGMSTRAIAPIVGVSREQVRIDVAGDNNLSPEPIINVIAETGEVVEEEPRQVTGLDGKTYTAPQPKPDKAVLKEVALVNDIRLYIRHVGSSKDTAALSVAAKQHIITALREAIDNLERSMT
jgi:transposase-like protein